MASRPNGTLYIGVTTDLPRRAWEHREGQADSFTTRYNCKTLVWYEPHESITAAITREKQLKGGSRQQKIALILSLNPDWRDLSSQL